MSGGFIYTWAMYSMGWFANLISYIPLALCVGIYDGDGTWASAEEGG